MLDPEKLILMRHSTDWARSLPLATGRLAETAPANLVNNGVDARPTALHYTILGATHGQNMLTTDCRPFGVRCRTFWRLAKHGSTRHFDP